MKEKLKKWLAGLLGSGIIALIVLAVFAVTALAGGNLMRLFGFRYESVWQLLLYFLAGAVIGLPLELFSTALPKALYAMKKVSRWQANLLYIPLDMLFTMLAFWLADRLMDSVSASGLALWVLGFWLAVTTLPVPKEK